MTGTENEVKAGSLGNIKDLLKKANGSDDSTSWRERLRGRVGGESPPTLDNTTDRSKEKVDNVDDDTQKAAKESAIVEESQQQESKPQTEEQQPKTLATPQPSECPSEKPNPSNKPSKQPTRNTKANGSHKFFEVQVNEFDQKASKGKRHMIFVTDRVFNTLSVVYGEKNISAVINALAENHIDKHKEEMKQSFRAKSPLFSE